MADREACRLPSRDEMVLRFIVDRLPRWFTRELDALLGKSDQSGRTFTGGIIRRLDGRDYFIELRFRESTDRVGSAELRALLAPLLALPMIDLTRYTAGDKAAIAKYGPLLSLDHAHVGAPPEKIGPGKHRLRGFAQTVLRERRK